MTKSGEFSVEDRSVRFDLLCHRTGNVIESCKGVEVAREEAALTVLNHSQGSEAVGREDTFTMTSARLFN